jgi:hypothetical protein
MHVAVALAALSRANTLTDDVRSEYTPEFDLLPGQLLAQQAPQGAWLN